jgi:ubiquitin C-terminal hydrolase
LKGFNSDGTWDSEPAVESMRARELEEIKKSQQKRTSKQQRSPVGFKNIKRRSIPTTEDQATTQTAKKAKHQQFTNEEPQKPRGLVNFGVSCFLNAIVQCLACTQPFCESISSANPSCTVTKALEDVINELHSTSHEGPLAPMELYQLLPMLNMQTGIQEDAAEFFDTLITQVAEEQVTDDSHSARPNVQLFCGKLKTLFRCPCCSHSHTNGPTNFNQLWLGIDGDNVNTLTSALAQFVQAETNNEYECPGCNRCNQGTLQQEIISISPTLLCIQLKKFINVFNQISNTWEMNKIDKVITYSHNLILPTEDSAEKNIP